MSKLKRSNLKLVAAIAMLLAPVACSSKPSSSSSSGGSAAANGNSGGGSADDGVVREPIFGTGKITGRVVLDGDPPAKKTIPMQGDRFCVQHGKVEVAEKYQVGEDSGLPFTFVYIKKGIAAKYPAPEEAKTLNQSGCKYEPHVFGIQVGQTLKIKNSDETVHNVNALAKKNDAFNVNQAQKDMVKDVAFKRPEVMLKFKCNVHGWMEAYAGILDHPFFAVTDENGNFEIDRLPPGKFTIEAWHEVYRTRTIEIEVKDGETTEANVTFKKR